MLKALAVSGAVLVFLLLYWLIVHIVLSTPRHGFIIYKNKRHLLTTPLYYIYTSIYGDLYVDRRCPICNRMIKRGSVKESIGKGTFLEFKDFVCSRDEEVRPRFTRETPVI